MKAHLTAAAVSLILGAYAMAADLPKVDPAPADRGAASMHPDAIKLCERLAGMEREICMQQALENQRLAVPPPVGATPATPGSGTVPAPGTAKPAR
ncbi:MAG TPA: hypothetical protein VHP37_24785 [Burkholderiales bacterium]|nr:hypothetical protein [Burkholderiales bacterium]